MRRLIKAWLLSHPVQGLLFSLLIAGALSIGLVLQAQETAIREASARIVDPASLLIGAPGSKNDLVLGTLFHEPLTLPLLDSALWAPLLAHERVDWAAPLAFGDNWQGHLIIGTTAPFIQHLGGTAQFTSPYQAIVGSNVALEIGQQFASQHGMVAHEDNHSHAPISVIGRLPITNTPWDNAILVPIRQVWGSHGLASAIPKDPQQVGYLSANEHLHGVTAVVVQPASLASAYGLRSQFNNAQVQAFFPAEVLVRLYSTLGDVRALMNVVWAFSMLLVMIALLYGLQSLLSNLRYQFAVLTALGMRQLRLWVSLQCYVLLLLVTALLLTALISPLMASWVAGWLGQRLSMALTSGLSWQSVQLAATVAASLWLCTLPAIWWVLRRPAWIVLQTR
ncbi:hypothetical protein [Salinibius halmophilus]|uniref:hypothetical protein n=1 Tax=Salinibius halmophilus TaxID=1853216 RepID=UPI000E66F7C0|nr:hypothetical protein [Salinibius halmophilus]